MIKISQIYNAVKGTQQEFEVVLNATDFPDLPFTGKITATGNIMRVEEGVMMLLNELEATQKMPCALCAKELSRKIKFTPSEWLFYQVKPLREDDQNELLTLDRTRMEIDPTEPIRQELILNIDSAPRCAKKCKKFEEIPEGIKALSSLKDLIKSV